jgi:hypothetical protein
MVVMMMMVVVVAEHQNNDMIDQGNSGTMEQYCEGMTD